MHHATAAIISAGDELTLGQKLDTNARWLAERLTSLGVIPIEHVTVPDDLDAHATAFARLADVADLIICTGGLGPTADDLTRQALARAMGDHLVEDPGALEQIRALFARRGRAMNDLNRAQALRPSRGRTLPNALGTAPGLHARLTTPLRTCDVFCLPGPPAEMMPMFDAQAVGEIHPPPGRAVRTRLVRTVGIGETDLAARLGPLMARDANPTVGTTASGGAVDCRIRYAGDPARASAELDRIESRVAELAEPFIYARRGESLASACVALLRSRSERISCVESCTGGLLGAALSETPGSSDVFLGGWITYSNELKSALVAVPPEIIARHGAVSRETALAMASGGRDRSGATWCLAITGIAGPSGGAPDKPVGTVWIALAGPDLADVRRFMMIGDRDSVRKWSVTAALAMLWLRASGKDATLLRQAE